MDKTPSPSPSVSPPPPSAALRLRDTLSGVAGAVCLTYAGLPFDVVKLRMQMAGAHALSSAPSSSSSSVPYRGAFDCLRRIVAEEGVLVLWRGAGPALASALVENAVVFTANGFFTRLFSSHDPSSLTFAEHAAIGGLSGVFSATAICPAEVVKCRLQHQHRQRQLAGADARAAASGGGLRVARDVWAAGGVRGFFAGLTPLLARDVPFNTLFFGAYRVYSHLLASLLGTAEKGGAAGGSGGSSGVRAFLSGGFAGMTAWTVVFPFDALKSRMQVGGGNAAAGGTGLRGVLRAVLTEGGGVRALYRGWSAAVLRAFPANAALFWGVESAEALLKRAGL
jgi:solute carrier family 25 ornithine transporter 2/15